ncbi:MAG: hypothetical protein II998_11225 [Clostridia bacterium]|nr:hypothetical protein [Clostridia bacterium]
MKMKKKHTIIKGFCCIIVTIILSIKFNTIKSQINSSLKIWLEIIVPSLFPYLILSQYISSSGFLNICKPLNRIISKIFNINSSCTAVYLCSLVCGYPSGAVCINELYKNKICSKEEAENVVCFTNNSSPLFLVSAVGGCMLGSLKDGLALYIIQLISSAIIGLFLRKRNKSDMSENIRHPPYKSLSDCCSSAVATLILICSQIIMWSIIAKIIIIISNYIIPSKISEYVAFSIFELSTAIKLISAFPQSAITFALISFCCSFGSISVIMQIKSVLPDEFSFKKIFISKTMQGIISFFLSIAYRTSMTDPRQTFNYSYPAKAMTLISIGIFILCLFYTSTAKKRKKRN